jgi:hypothetical protein
MSDEVINDEGLGPNDAERQAEAEALAQMMAGYSRKEARADEAPADVVTPPSDTPEAVEPVITDRSTNEPQAELSLADQLAALKAQVHAMAGQGEPEAVRKLHGEIGNINRTLKQIQDAQPKPEPVKDELTQALEDAEKIAGDFPEIAGPLVKAMKALKEKSGQPQSFEPADIESRVLTLTEQKLQQQAIEQLAEEHPDYETVRDTPEFKSWEASKTPEFQKRLRETWNPAVVSKALTEFKDSLKAKATKQKRLEAAVVTPGTSGQAKPSTLSDEEALWAGYHKGPKRLNSR